MKSIILGIIGAFITFYTFLIGTDILIFQTSKNTVEKQVSRIVGHVLETGYGSKENAVVEQILLEELEASISEKGKMRVEILAMDMQKGILSVKVILYPKLLNGKEKEIVVCKTAIVEQSVWQEYHLEVG